MVRRLTFLAAFLFLISLARPAQAQVELFGGYSYLHYRGVPSANLNGWEVSGQYKFAKVIGGVVDVDAHYGSPSGINTRTVSFLFGPQISFPGRISPFFHVLVGAGHIDENGITDTSFSTAVGGGVDTRIAPLISWRVIQVDDLMTRFFGGTQHNARISTGLVFRF